MESPSETSSKHVVQPPLRYRTRILWLLGFYVLLISVPWVLTCVLAHRPINSRSYARQQGFLNQDVSSMHNWKIAVNVLNSIAGLITNKLHTDGTLPDTHANYTNHSLVPFLSAFLAQAAVLFCQRRKLDEFLSLRDMFILADRGWTSVPMIWRSIWSRQKVPGRKSSAAFLLPAACLILLGAIQQPLYQILVRDNTVSVATCRDIPALFGYKNCTGSQLYEPIGKDIEPAQMATAEHLVLRSRVVSELASITVDEPQSNLWSANATYRPGLNHVREPLYIEPRSLRYWEFRRGGLWPATSDDVPDFFVAGLPAGTTTGVLRQHLMRLNSSVSCEEIDPGDFPSPCPGDQPFTVFWNRVMDTDVRVCVPGNFSAFPWRLSRSRQEHAEELYIDLKDTSVGDGWEDTESENPMWNTSYIIHCRATTTRGYFELGNDRNKDMYGPLLEKWPSREQMAENYNDWTDTAGYYGSNSRQEPPYVPSDVDTFQDLPPYRQYVDPFDSVTWRVPGPLMTSALALFGNGSWLSVAAKYVSNETYHAGDPENDQKLSWQLLCSGMPFSRLFLPSDRGEFLKDSLRLVSLCRWLQEGMFNGYGPSKRDLFEITHRFLRALGPVVDEKSASKDKNLYSAENLLKCSMFVANRAFLKLLSADGFRNDEVDLMGRTIYTSPGIAVQKPVLSKATLIVLSILMGLQLLGLSYLTYYLYRVPTWSSQLDAMAMARIGASLNHQGILPAIGPVSKTDLAALQTVGGLIGIVEKSECSMTRSMSPDMTTTHGSEVELQRLTWTEEGSKNIENGSTSVELGLDAPGPILTTDLPRRSPYVRAWKSANISKDGLKGAWRATFISRVKSKMDRN